MRDSNRIQFRPADSRLFHGRGRHHGEIADVFTRGDFRHHAAIRPVAGNLLCTTDESASQPLRHNGGGGFVARIRARTIMAPKRAPPERHQRF